MFHMWFYLACIFVYLVSLGYELLPTNVQTSILILSFFALGKFFLENANNENER